MLVSFFLGLGQILPYIPWFAAIATLNLRGGFLSKWPKLCISIVTLGLFVDGRSKLASVWCPVSIFEHKVFMENDRKAYKIQVFYVPKWSTKYKSRLWRFIEMEKTVDFKCVSFFFLVSWSDLALYTMVCSNHYKCVFLLEMTRHTEILITCVHKQAINVEFMWCRFIQMTQIVHFDCQTRIVCGWKIKIGLCMVPCKYSWKEGFYGKWPNSL